MRCICVLGVALLLGCDGGSSGSKEDDGAKAKAESEGSLGAFSKYKRKSITSEARVMLAKMADSAAAAYMEEQVVPGSLTVERKLPESAPMTPAAGSCCREKDGKCPPDNARWEHPTWKRLMFDIADPHYYSYEFVSKGDSFVARAVGDLDCDGTMSTFEIAGSVKDGAVERAALTTKNELE